MPNEPTHPPRGTAAPHGAEWEGDWDAAAEPAPVPGERHLDTVAQVLSALPAGETGRVLKLALLDALEASARADRVTLPVELRALCARVRAGTA